MAEISWLKEKPRRGMTRRGGALLLGHLWLGGLFLPRFAADDVAGKADAFRDHEIEPATVLVGGKVNEIGFAKSGGGLPSLQSMSWS